MTSRVRSVSTLRLSLALPSDFWNQLLAVALAEVPDIELVASATVLESASRVAVPAVLLTAVPSSYEGWNRLRRWCQSAGLRVLVLGENRPQLAVRALRLGASGYLDWESGLAQVVKAIRSVHAGELWADRKVALSVLRPEPGVEGQALTPRELRVLEVLAQGKRNKEIAAQLAITETTVKSHLNRAYQKLHVSDRLEAALYVERHGLD